MIKGCQYKKQPRIHSVLVYCDCPSCVVNRSIIRALTNKRIRQQERREIKEQLLEIEEEKLAG